MKHFSKAAGPAILVGVLGAQSAAAQEATPASDAAVFVFNTGMFLFCGLLAMLMAVGFCLREAGLVRAKNAAAAGLKIIAVFAVAGIMAWLVGYNLLYGVEPGGLLGPFKIWSVDDADPVGVGHAAASGFLLQMAFAALTAAIVSGALAERVKLWPFIIFSALLTGLIYPIEASWAWGKGFLHAEFGFVDFAGATLVHAAGGWAALAGALALGPRRGKYSGGHAAPSPGSNLPLAALGTLLLWLGWFGFNGGSQLMLGTIPDAIAVAKIILNTNMAACGGVLAAIILTSMIYRKVDLAIVLNGAVGGLVSISAEPLAPAIWQAVLIGAFGGVIVTVGAPLLDRLKVDDVVGAIPAHLLCGIWGTFIVPWTNDSATFLGQGAGVAMIGGFVFVMSGLIWVALKYSVGLRVSAETELAGLDRAVLGLEADPGFSKP